jgi:hypothetical protein
VVPHDGACAARIHHAPHRHDRLELQGASIDEVAHEESRALGMAPRAARLAVAEVPQQRGERVRVPVDVADDVVIHGLSCPARLRLPARGMRARRLATRPIGESVPGIHSSNALH